MVQDIAKSVRNRLLEQTRNNHGNYQQVLIRYVHERLMYRLSKSKYKSSFYLKGGSLLFALNPIIARPTLDVDLLGINFPSKPELLRSMFEDICAQDCPEDGLIFDKNNILVANIMNDKEYQGLRVQIQAHLDTICQRISVDVGFGDAVIGVKEMDIPTLLGNLPKANVLAYSIESIMAEKFHAMIARDESNSRMKDFFDVYQILTNQTFDESILEKAIRATFKARHTQYQPSVKLFAPDFTHDSERQSLWVNFLRKIKYANKLDFEVVVQTICNRLGKYWSKELLD